MTPQCEKILNHMMIYGSITGLQSINELGVLNYKGRIADLRKLGYTIETKWVTQKNRKGESKTFARYVLKGLPQDCSK